MGMGGGFWLCYIVPGVTRPTLNLFQTLTAISYLLECRYADHGTRAHIERRIGR